MPRARTPRARVPRVKTAEIGHFDGELHKIVFNQGDTIQALLDKTDLEYGKGVEINDEKGETVLPTTTVRNNAIYYLAGNFENGRQ